MRCSIKPHFLAALVLAAGSLSARAASAQAPAGSPAGYKPAAAYLDAGSLGMGALFGAVHARLGGELGLEAPAPWGGALSVGAEVGLYLSAPSSSEGRILQLDLAGILRWRPAMEGRGPFAGLGLGAIYASLEPEPGEGETRLGALGLAELGWAFALLGGDLAIEPLARAYLAVDGPAPGGGLALVPSYSAGLRLAYRF